MDDLRTQELEAKKRRYPNVPDYAITRSRFKKDGDTNSLTNAIIKYLGLKRFFVSRIQSQGQYNPTISRWTYGKTVKGIPDIYAQGYISDKPITIWVEVKSASTKDKLKPHQVEVHKKLTDAGALVYVARTFDEFVQWFSQISEAHQ